MKVFEDEEGEIELKTKLGTDGYMAPEIKAEESYQGPPVDIFACGVVLFQMLTCNQPFLNGGDEFHIRMLDNPEEELQRRNLSISDSALDLFMHMI